MRISIGGYWVDDSLCYNAEALDVGDSVKAISNSEFELGVGTSQRCNCCPVERHTRVDGGGGIGIGETDLDGGIGRYGGGGSEPYYLKCVI